MDTWKNNKNADTNSDFYSNIDKLIKLVHVALEKDQVKNAELYLNYFFEVMIRFYQKSSKSSKITQQSPAFTGITSNYELDINKKEIKKPLLPERNIKNVFGDFFTDKILRLLSENIKNGGFEIFTFILSRLKDSIRVLIKEKASYEKAAILLGQFKFIVDQVHSKQRELSTYEKAWFLSASYDWFIELYTGSVNSSDDIEVLESEILQVLRYFVDTKQVDLFERFLERLSSSVFSFSFEKEKIITLYKPSDYPTSYKYETLIRQYRRDVLKLRSPYEFKEFLKALDEKIDTDFKDFKLNELEISDFKIQFWGVLLDDFKESYIKVILIKIIVYSIFKTEFLFFEKYLNYNQPKDSDAIWANRYFGISSANEVVQLIDTYGDSILNDNLFRLGHHGFKIYLNTFLGYYLITWQEKDILAAINSIEDYEQSVLIKYGLENIKSRNNILEIPDIKKNYSSDSINEKLNKFISAASEKKDRLDSKKITESELSEEILQNFKKLFVDSFYKFSSLRLIFKKLNLLQLLNEESKIDGFGINELLDKKAFLKESDVLYFNLHDSLAEGLADSENLSILFNLEKACKRIKLTQKEFEIYLQANKSNYDIILSRGRFIVKSDFTNLSFTESWSLPQDFNNIPDFLGQLENHYAVFYLRVPSEEGYILLNSKKLGNLNQFNPPEFKDAKRADIFNFSIIDFKNDKDSLQKHLDNGGSKEELMKNIWLRIFEKFEIELAKDFNGIRIELTS